MANIVRLDAWDICRTSSNLVCFHCMLLVVIFLEVNAIKEVEIWLGKTLSTMLCNLYLSK